MITDPTDPQLISFTTLSKKKEKYFMTYEMWHVTQYMWHMTHENRWGEVNPVSKFQLLNSLVWFGSEGISQRMTDSVSDLMNHKGVCRTAPTKLSVFIMLTLKALYLQVYIFLIRIFFSLNAHIFWKVV